MNFSIVKLRADYLTSIILWRQVLRICLYPTSRYGIVVEPLNSLSLLRQLLIRHYNQPLAPYKDGDTLNRYKAFISA